jgi:hypothetical protein
MFLASVVAKVPSVSELTVTEAAGIQAVLIPIMVSMDPGGRL